MEVRDWLVTFNDNDIEAAKRESRIRILPKKFRQTHIPPSSPYHDAYTTDLIGVVCEMAGAFALGVEREVSRPTLRGNPGWNFIYRGWKVAVSGCSQAAYNMWTKFDDPLKFEIILHCNAESDDLRSVRVVSWLWEPEFVSRRTRVVRPSGEVVWQVGAMGTSYIDSLPTIPQKEQTDVRA